MLKAQGFATGAFVASVVLDRQAGLARGFDVYSGSLRRRRGSQEWGGRYGEAIDWLKAEERFLAWVHLYDVHGPALPPPEYTAPATGGSRTTRRSRGAMRWSGSLLIDALRSAGRLDDTLVIVTSDHGEGLGDHGEDTHGFFVYESTLRVPLVIRGPAVKAGTRLEGVARTIDLLPTILELTGSPSRGSVRPQPGGGVARRWTAPGRSGVRRVAAAIDPFWLERPAGGPRRPLEDNPGAAARAVRPSIGILANVENLAATEQARAEAMRAGLTARLAAGIENGERRYRGLGRPSGAARAARRARVRLAGRMGSGAGDRRRPEGPSRGVSIPVQRHAPGAPGVAAGPRGGRAAILRKLAEARRRQFGAPLLPGADARRTGPPEGGGRGVRTGGGETARLRGRLAGSWREPRVARRFARRGGGVRGAGRDCPG